MLLLVAKDLDVPKARRPATIAARCVDSTVHVTPGGVYPSRPLEVSIRVGHLLTTLLLSLLQRFRVVTLPGIVRILDWKVKIGRLSTRPALSIAAASTVERWVTSQPNVPSPQGTRHATTVEERVTSPRSALTLGKRSKQFAVTA